MMNQFEVVFGYLCVTDMTRWDFFYGLRRVIKKLK